MHVVSAFYHFSTVKNPKEIRLKILQKGDDLDIMGAILLGKEGINGTISGSNESINEMMKFINTIDEFNGFNFKLSKCDECPFYRFRVKLKKEIVTIGIESVNPRKKVGEYISPENWNNLISDPDTILIDTRNDFEYKTGTFKGSINPETKTFRDFPNFVQKNLLSKKKHKIAMFCTGGIRCEKASSYMLGEGFENVYHLDGGILNYLEKVDKYNSMWEGNCFVFDRRTALSHDLEEIGFKQCPSCSNPLSNEDQLNEKYEKGVKCHNCSDKISDKRLESLRQRHMQILISKKNGEKHIGRKISKS